MNAFTGLDVPALNVTAPDSDNWEFPKLNPLMVTWVPATPELTDKLEIEGVGTTVKIVPLGLAVELLVITTFPVVAPLGTTVAMVELVQLVTCDATPLKATVPVEPKLYPVIVTLAPTGPEAGERLVMLGITVKGFGLLSCTIPGVPSLGTWTMIEPELHDDTAADTVPKFTVLLPWFIPKLLPDSMTFVPVEPEEIESEAILGVGSTLGVIVSFATKASDGPFNVVWYAPVLIGKSAESAEPVTYVLPMASRAIR
jgi:hypothetical protein